MTSDEKLTEIAKNLAALKTDMSWLRESWNKQQDWSLRQEKRITILEKDVVKQKGKPTILMLIITALTAILAAIIGWAGAK